MLDITLSGGNVVTPSGARVMDVHITDGVIAAVTLPGAEGFEAGQTIDATGMIVVPGGVEPHAHIGGPRQPARSGAEPVSKAAIFGGTTTVLDFATQVPGHDLLHAVDEAAERWKGQGYTDYAYHPICGHRASDTDILQIP